MDNEGARKESDDGMNANAAELEQLMARLLSDDADVQRQARNEVQAWPFETVAAMLGVAAQQANEAAFRPSNVWQWFRWWKLGGDSPAFPLPFDMLTVMLVDTQEDVRFAWAAMASLGCYYAFRKGMAQPDVEVGRPRWGSGLMMLRQPIISLDFDLAGIDPFSAWYARYEKPLLACLKRLLPRIDTTSCSVPLSHRAALLNALRHPYRDVELTLCLLDFLGAMGGAECFATLEQLQTTCPNTDNGRRVEAAARSCRTQIKTRTDKKGQAQMLLRAAAPPTPAEAETLLRAVRETDPTMPPEQLLRPSE